MKKKVFLDMDGVLVDFVSASLRANNINSEHDKIVDWDYWRNYGVSDEDFWSNVEEQGVDFWANLEKYEWSDLIINTAKATSNIINWYICTTPSNCPNCFAGKKMWLDENFPGFRTFFCSDKSLLAGQKRLLIDDSDRNCEKWVRKGGESFLFPQPWNKSNIMTDRREELVLGRINAFIGQ